MTSAPALDPSAARAAADESAPTTRVATVECASAARSATVELYAAARPAVAMAGLSSGQLVEFVGECEAGIRSFEAARTLALARLAATEEVVLEDGTIEEISQGLGYRRLDAPDLVSEALGLSAQAAGAKVDDAVVLATKLPALVDAMGAGRVDAYRAGIIATELREAPRAVCDEVLARIDASLAKPGWVLRQRTRRALEVLDEDWLITKTRRARSALGLRMVPNEDSTDTWTAILPTEQSREAWAAVEPLAKQIRDTDGVTLDVARAKAMTQLMLGNCSGTFHVHFAVPADQADDFAARFTGSTPDPTTTDTPEHGPAVQPEDPAVKSARATERDADAVGVEVPSLNPTVAPATLGDADGEAGIPFAPDLEGDDDRSMATAPAATRPTDAATCGVADGCEPAAADPSDDPLVVTGLGTAGTTIVPAGWLADVLAGKDGTVEADVIGCDRVTGGFVTNPIPLSTPAGPKTSRRRRRRAPNLATEAYRPTADCRAYVKARDQRCRFPGCRASAYFTDLDHVRAWPLGPTDPANLACLCRRHHRIKQRPGWTVRLNPDGSMDWTDPTGMARTTYPVDHLGTRQSSDPGTNMSRPGGADLRGSASSFVEFGDPTWDGDYHDPDAYTRGIPVWLAAQLELTAALNTHRRPEPTPAADPPLTNVERLWENRLLAEHDDDVQRPLLPIDGRDVRWLDRGARRYELASAAVDDIDEPPF